MLKKVGFFAAIVLFSAPSFASAAPIEVSGWIPYWRAATGTKDVLANIDRVSEVHPFVYTIKKDGSLADNGKMDQEPWASFTKAAQAKGVKVIPTVMASDGATIHALLKNDKTRIKLEDEIKAVVEKHGFDGIDIDLEGKKVESRQYFNLFLKGTKMRLGNKILSCTIESRTPPENLYRMVPKNLEYVNDFKTINKYCDRVKFMTYDQQSAIYSLNQQNKAWLYMPVSDTAWVEMAIRFAMKSIDKKKIMLGIPTYGYEYNVTGAIGDYRYKLLWTFNPGYAQQMMDLHKRPKERGIAGEMTVTYVATSSVLVVPPGASIAMPVPMEGVKREVVDEFKDNPNKIVGSFRYLTWPDATSIEQKVKLAEHLGIRGVAVFKFDGGQDPGMWSVLPKQR